MTSTLEMRPITKPIRGDIRPPGSKSLTNRALIVASLANGASTLTGVLDSQDTRVMIESLRRLGLEITHSPQDCIVSIGGGGGTLPADKAELWLENSGTSIRFLTALCALGKGTYRLDGVSRMRQRPIQDLTDALNRLGCSVRCESDTGCPPVLVTGTGLKAGSTQLSVDLSSQFLSALLMVAPCADGPVEISLNGAPVSEPYIDMTLGVMARFGATVDTSEPGRYLVTPRQYLAGLYEIEPDASAASYFFAAAAITGGSVTVQGLTYSSLQGDIHFVDALEEMGCRVDWNDDSVTVHGGPLRGIEIDMNAISDTAQTLAAVAVFAEGATTIRNIGHVRHKETDRITAVVTELRRLGVQVEEFDDGLTIHPGPVRSATIETYLDHRMAMSFALIGLRHPGIVLKDPGCTAKTYPGFFEDVERLCESAR